MPERPGTSQTIPKHSNGSSHAQLAGGFPNPADSLNRLDVISMKCRGGLVAVEAHDDSGRIVADPEDFANLPSSPRAPLRTELAQLEALANSKQLFIVRIHCIWLSPCLAASELPAAC